MSDWECLRHVVLVPNSLDMALQGDFIDLGRTHFLGTPVPAGPGECSQPCTCLHPHTHPPTHPLIHLSTFSPTYPPTPPPPCPLQTQAQNHALALQQLRAELDKLRAAKSRAVQALEAAKTRHASLAADVSARTKSLEHARAKVRTGDVPVQGVCVCGSGGGEGAGRPINRGAAS